MIEGNNKHFQSIVEINAGAALYISGIVKDLQEGFNLAKNTIDNKKSKQYLEKIIL